MGAREDRQADHVDVLLDGRGGDLLGRQADALVDHLHAGVAGADGDLLGAVGVAVEPRLCDEDLDPVADESLTAPTRSRTSATSSALPPAAQPPTPVGAAVGPEDLAQRLRPLPGGHAGLASGVDRRWHQVRRLVAGRLGERREGPLDRVAIALRLPLLERLDPAPARPPGRG